MQELKFPLDKFQNINKNENENNEVKGTKTLKSVIKYCFIYRIIFSFNTFFKGVNH